MKIILSVLVLSLPVAASAQEIVAPEVVQLESMHVADDMKTVNVGNANNHYSLYCSIKNTGCITPTQNTNYLLFNKNTHWRMPGAKDFSDLAFFQSWVGQYNSGENIGLMPEKGGAPSEIGLFLLDKTGGGYLQDTIIADGPIIYGTGMSEKDRAEAWKHFVLMMVEASDRQHGIEASKLNLARRCQPGRDFCTQTLDANFVGIGQSKEPRRVVLMLVTDVHNEQKQLSRIVCTWPVEGVEVCRDWGTGKLVSNDMGQQ